MPHLLPALLVGADVIHERAILVEQKRHNVRPCRADLVTSYRFGRFQLFLLGVVLGLGRVRGFCISVIIAT